MADAASHPNAGLIGRFYDALGRRDAPAMIGCYAPDATFSDPVFPALDAAGVAAMWTMLCARGKDLAVVASDIGANESSRAHWVATCLLGHGAARRKSHRRVVLLRDGLIVHHVDRFDLWRWLQQALGVKGALVGWLPPVQRTVRAQAAKALADWRTRDS
jgi:hypothetical protein